MGGDRGRVGRITQISSLLLNCLLEWQDQVRWREAGQLDLVRRSVTQAVCNSDGSGACTGAHGELGWGRRDTGDGTNSLVMEGMVKRSGEGGDASH